ncbi:hypothetical protein HanIR_Chr09g0404271 [Helianthus annuus]|nr:hypothetical protein HanIR_Chr09g0404271 [Helianthus annuus]
MYGPFAFFFYAPQVLVFVYLGPCALLTYLFFAFCLLSCTQCSPKSRRRRTHIQDLKPSRSSNTHSSSHSQPQSPAIPMRPSVRSSAVAALYVTVLLFASPVFGSDYDHKDMRFVVD